MKDYKKIINYILDNSSESMATIVLKFGYLFNDGMLLTEHLYSIILKDDVWQVQYLNTTKEKISRYKTNIRVESKLNK